MSAVIPSRSKPFLSAQGALRYSAISWFAVALIGQWLFVLYIAVAFGGPVVTDNLSAINETRPIDGYIPGDTANNALMLSHVFLGAIVSFGGLLQLVPWLRRNATVFHRWNGRLFLSAALIAAIGGLYLTWIRGSRLSDLGAVGNSLNGVLILGAALWTWWLARNRRFPEHRRWAIRTFLLVSGVWTFRLALMGWYMANQGPLGNTVTLDGPTDLAISFGCYLVPLAIAEIYFRAQSSTRPGMRWSAAAIMGVSTLATGFGIVAAFFMMWRPHIFS